MPYQNDMQTLGNIVSPAYAAMQAGISNDAQNQKEQMANEQFAGQMPAEIAKPGLANMFTQAQTGEANARTQGLNLSNQGVAATQPGAIAATNATNQTKISTEQAQAIGNLGTITGQIAGLMDSVPAAARPAAMQQVLQKYGVDASKLPQELLNGDPDMLRNMSQKMVQMSSGYQTEQLKGSNAYAKDTAVANIHGDSAKYAADQQRAGREYVSDNKRAVDQMKQTVDQTIAQITQRVGTDKEQPGDKERLQFLAQQQTQLRQMQALNTQQLLGMTPQAPSLNIGGGGGGSAPTGTPAVNVPAIGEMLKAQGQQYEPDKYDYRVGSNGKVQRAPK